MDRRKIEIRFFDPDLKFIGEEDAYQGLEFITRWTKYGTFQIFVDKLTKQMKVGNYIMLDNDRRKTGIIKRIECSDEDESGVPITIGGYMCPIDMRESFRTYLLFQHHIQESSLFLLP